MSEEALQITVKRREVKSKGENKRYNNLNIEFQKIARRDKKAFFSNQCKEIEENNRIGKTRDLFKKIRDTKGTFYAKMGSIKDRNVMDLTEAENIKKRWQEIHRTILCMKVRDIVQETGIKTIPMEKKSKKAKWLSEEALQSYEKKRSKKQRRKKQNGKDYRSLQEN